MKLFPDSKTFIEIFGLGITWYAILILTGALITYFLTYRNFKKRGYNLEIVDDLFYGGLLSGIVGARLWYVIFDDLPSYLADPVRILNFREGGLAIHGGLIFGVIFGLIYVQKKRVSFMRIADETVYNILIAQAVGRWGNFMNQEAFGGVVEASYYEGWPAFIRNRMFVGGQYRQPTFLFESVLNVIGWIIIHFLLRRNKNRKEGDLVYAYLMWYGVVRFIVEGMRSDSLYLGTLRIAQLVSIVAIVVGLLGYLGVFRKIFKPKKPSIIVDFDGTIANTAPIIHKVYREIFTDYPEVKLSEEDYERMVGPTLESTFEKHLPNEDTAALVERYRNRNRQLHPEMIQAIPQAKEVLSQLKQQGYPLAIASNKKTDMIHYGLELMGMDDLFDVVIGSDLVTHSKPNPEMLDLATKQLNAKRDNVIYIGDTKVDMLTGKNYNAYTIGYHLEKDKLQQLEEDQPNYLMENWDELTTLLKQERLWIYNTK